MATDKAKAQTVTITEEQSDAITAQGLVAEEAQHEFWVACVGLCVQALEQCEGSTHGLPTRIARTLHERQAERGDGYEGQWKPAKDGNKAGAWCQNLQSIMRSLHAGRSAEWITQHGDSFASHERAVRALREEENQKDTQKADADKGGQLRKPRTKGDSDAKPTEAPTASAYSELQQAETALRDHQRRLISLDVKDKDQITAVQKLLGDYVSEQDHSAALQRLIINCASLLGRFVERGDYGEADKHALVETIAEMMAD